MNWRWYVFWVKDILTGRKVRTIYEELCQDDCCFDKEKQIKKINKLLTYAKNNCRYYDKYDINIKKFPIVNKQIIKDNYNDIFVKKYDKSKLHKMSTSGSTGTPFTVYQNIEKRNSVLAEVLFFGKKAGFYFGEKQLFSRIWVSSIKKSSLMRFLQNMECFDVSHLDDSNLKLLYNTIVEKKVKCVLGYASSLHAFGKYIENKEIAKNKLKVIISGSELLNEKTRKLLSKKFNCKVYSRYSNEENGLLGQDNGITKEMWLNETNYYWEFLKLDSNEDAKPGELARVVITDLNNYAMPMIRYDTGDLCKYKKQGDKKIITEIFGRRIDSIYDTKGLPISPHLITNNMWDVKHIIQWKFSQLDKKTYKISLNVDKDFNGEKEIRNKILNIIGKDATIKFEYVDEIPVLNSGKRKYIENLYNK